MPCFCFQQLEELQREVDLVNGDLKRVEEKLEECKKTNPLIVSILLCFILKIVGTHSL